MKILKDKVVLITGAGSGIGLLMALSFADEGSKVILWDIDKDNIDKLREKINSENKTAYSYKCDVTDRIQVYKLKDEIYKKVGKVDILINNAGIVSGKTFLECDDDILRKSMEVNVISNFWTVKAFLPDMIKSNSGHIVTISSAAGLIGVAGLADYSASKFAVFGFNESIRMELRKKKIKGVKTTIVCSYYINTGMFDGVKTKFSFFLPILNQNKVTKKIIKSVKKNKKVLIMPWFVKVLPLARILPQGMMDALADFFGISSSMDEFKGRKK